VKTCPSPLLPVAILAGGRGTRLGAIARDTPKALVRVAGEPFVFHQLRQLARQGARDIVLCVGHLGEQIADAVGDGARFGLDVRYAFDGPEPVGTAAALRRALPLLGGAFLTTYGDAYLRIDHRSVQRAFEDSGMPALMTVLENEGRWGPSNAHFAEGLVTAYDKRTPPPGARFIDYGLLAFTPDALERDQAADLADVCSHLAAHGRLAGVVARERFYEIGTEGALAETDRFLRADAAGRRPS